MFMIHQEVIKSKINIHLMELIINVDLYFVRSFRKKIRSKMYFMSRDCVT